VFANQKFNKLTAIKYVGKDKNEKTLKIVSNILYDTLQTN
jgi:hypothetical protein